MILKIEKIKTVDILDIPENLKTKKIGNTPSFQAHRENLDKPTLGHKKNLGKVEKNRNIKSNSREVIVFNGNNIHTHAHTHTTNKRLLDLKFLNVQLKTYWIIGKIQT